MYVHENEISLRFTIHRSHRRKLFCIKKHILKIIDDIYNTQNAFVLRTQNIIKTFVNIFLEKIIILPISYCLLLIQLYTHLHAQWKFEIYDNIFYQQISVTPFTKRVIFTSFRVLRSLKHNTSRLKS